MEPHLIGTHNYKAESGMAPKQDDRMFIEVVLYVSRNTMARPTPRTRQLVGGL